MYMGISISGERKYKYKNKCSSQRGRLPVGQNRACQEQVEVPPQGWYHEPQRQRLCVPESHRRGRVVVCGKRIEYIIHS